MFELCSSNLTFVTFGHGLSTFHIKFWFSNPHIFEMEFSHENLLGEEKNIAKEKKNDGKKRTKKDKAKLKI